MKNYLFILATILLISISSCKVKQSIADVVIVDNNNTGTTEQKDTIALDVITIDTLETIDTFAIIDSNFIDDTVLKLKDQYNIAIILPLFTDSINMSFETHVETDMEDFIIPTKAVKALNFIEGMILSLEEKPIENLKLNIKVYDNESNILKTKNIVSKLAFEDIDFIIAPISSKNIKVVTEFAKEKNIMVISPFSHSKIASNNFSSYTMLNPSLDTHLKTIAKYISDSLNNAHIKILYPNTVKGEAYSSLMQNIINTINDTLEISKKISYALVEVESNTNDRRNFKIEDYLDLDAENAVIVLPASTGFIHNMLTKLNEKHTKYDITVFGMPNWKKSKTLRMDYFNNLKVHFSDVKWIDNNDLKTKSFKNNYKDKYKGYPTDEAYMGYDLFNYFSFLIDKYGLSLSENIHKETYNGIFGNYHFEKIYTNNSYLSLDNINQTVRIENTDLHIIYYKDFRLYLKK